jgi:hypothetical protein
MNKLGITTTAEKMMIELLPEELREKDSRLMTLGKYALRVSVTINTFKPVLTLLVLMTLSAFPVLAQSNPFPTRGDQSLGNLVSGGLGILSWLALAVGIGSFCIIPIQVFRKAEWMNFVWSGIFGVGGWMAAGSLAYMLANNQDTNLPDLDI